MKKKVKIQIKFDNFSKKFSSGENIDLINLEENIAFLQSIGL